MLSPKSRVRLPLMLRLVNLRPVIFLFLPCTFPVRFYDFRFQADLLLQLQCTKYLSSSFSCCTNITTLISFCNKLVIPHPLASPSSVYSPISLAYDRDNIILNGVTCRFPFEYSPVKKSRKYTNGKSAKKTWQKKNP